MSTAHKCDKCGTFYEPGPGIVVLDVHVQEKDDEVFSGWTDVELCAPCGKRVLLIVKDALTDLDQKLLK